MDFLRDFLTENVLIQNCVLVIGSLVILGLARFAYLISKHGQSPPVTVNRTNPCPTMIVMGSGGHTSEMITLLSGMNMQQYTPRTYVVADGDKMSTEKVMTFEKSFHKKSVRPNLQIVPRARQVKQSYLTSVFTTLYATMYSLPIVFKTRPDLLLCNGPGTCIPICFWAFLLRFLFLKDLKIVYVESLCRVEHLSLSGFILYYLYVADHVIVQWPALQKLYPRTSYLGSVV